MNVETQTDQDQQLAELVTKQLDMFRPILHSEGGDAWLVSLKEGVATVFMNDGGCVGCGTTPLAAMEGGLARTILERVDGLKDVVFARGPQE